MAHSSVTMIKRLQAEAAKIAKHGPDVMIGSTKYPLDSFIEPLEVPTRTQDTAFDILVSKNTRHIPTEFVLIRHDGKVAHYAGLCPRCGLELIEIEAELEPDGRFKAWPLIPNLCLRCEDALDELLERWMAEKVARAQRRPRQKKAPVAAPQGL